MNGKKQTIMLALILVVLIANLIVTVNGRVKMEAIEKWAKYAEGSASDASSRADDIGNTLDELIEKVDDLESATLNLVDEVDELSN